MPAFFISSCAASVIHRADAGRTEGQLAGMRLGVVDELLHRIHRHLVVDHHRGRVFGGAGDRHDDPSSDRTAACGSIAIVDHQRAEVADHQRVAVGRPPSACRASRSRPGAGLVLDHDRLPEFLAQPLAISRPDRSVMPPAGNGTINRTAATDSSPRPARRPRRSWRTAERGGRLARQ